LSVALAAAAVPERPLEIYVIDTEGGKAVLWIAPPGQTVLIDSGNPGTRDVDRLMEAISAAGVTRIDYLISTHYHVDHVGGLIFDVPFLVSYLSRCMSLQSGDIILTGTPPGVGLGQKPPTYLRAGRQVRAGVQGLGEQRQRVVE
jgi:ribonuclease BN (tRNA processing enzyme)